MDLYNTDAPISPKAEFPCAFPALSSTATAWNTSSRLPAEYIALHQNLKKLPQSMRRPLILFLLVNLKSGIKKVSRMLCTAGLSLTPYLCQINCKQAEKGFIYSKPTCQILPGYIAKTSGQIPTNLGCFCTFSSGLGIQEATSIEIPKIPRANWVFRASIDTYTQAPLSRLRRQLPRKQGRLFRTPINPY